MNKKKWTIYLCLAFVAIGATLFAACGGDDDDDDTGGSTSGATGSDEKFVADICKAGSKFSKDLDAATKDIATLTDPKKVAEKLSGPFDDFANSFSKAKPPKDLVDWHKDASSKLKDAASALKKGDLESDIFTQDSPFPDPPKDAADRLSKIADKDKDCADANFDFSGS